MYLSLSVPSDRVDVFRAAAAALLAAAAIISLISLISPVQELEAEINSFRLSGGGPAARSSAAFAADPTPTPSPTVAALAAPVLTAQASEDGVELSWTTVHGATRYELLVWDSVNDWRQIGGDGLTGTTYTHIDLVAGATYFYTILAANADGETSAWSDHVSTVTPTHTLAATPTATHTPAATVTATHTPAATVTATHTPAATVTATHTPAATVTATHTPAATVTATHTPAATPTPTHTPAATVTATHTPAATVTATHTPAATTGQPSDSSQNDVTVKGDSGNEGNVSPGQTSEDKTRTEPRQGLSGPTVSITGGDGVVVVGGENQVNGASFNVTITFSENVGATFDHTDITVTNAQTLAATDVSASTAGLIYIATVRPTAGFSGTVTVQVPADAAQNASNEGNQASNVFSVTATHTPTATTGRPSDSSQNDVTVKDDSGNEGNVSPGQTSEGKARTEPRQGVTGPTVTIAGAEGVVVVGGDNQVNGASFDVTITFSESVGTTFDHTEITVTNGESLAATDFITSTAGLIYTATIRPTAGFSGAVTVQVPAAAAQNASNEGNQASNVFSATATMQSACVTGGAVSAGDEYAELARDCATLLGLHDELVGSATLSPAWSVSTPILTWQGINLEAMRVSQLLLEQQGLTGSLPAALGDLDGLTQLSLWGNTLTGEIPSELGSLSELNWLLLRSNQLSGVIPSELGALVKLNYLQLQSNSLTGPIPPEIGRLVKLKELRLSSNQLNGPIPPELGDLSALENLVIGNNQYESPLPATLTNLTGLTTLDVREGKLTGTLPDLGQMTSLQYVYLQENLLTGTIPESVTRLGSLKWLILSSNQLTGSILDFSSMMSLRSLVLDRNQL